MPEDHSKMPRLRFSDDEKAEPALEKPRRKVKAAEKKLDKAEGKMPTRKKFHMERTTDAKNGKPVVRLRFGHVPEKAAEIKKPNKTMAAMRAASASLLNQQKGEETESRGDSGTDAARKALQSAKDLGEKAYQTGQNARYAQKLRPHRKLEKA